MTYADLKPGMILFNPKSTLSFLFIKSVELGSFRAVHIRYTHKGLEYVPEQSINKHTWSTMDYGQTWKIADSDRLNLYQIIRFAFIK
jgi:hypothetical protein